MKYCAAILKRPKSFKKRSSPTKNYVPNLTSFEKKQKKPQRKSSSKYPISRIVRYTLETEIWEINRRYSLQKASLRLEAW